MSCKKPNLCSLRCSSIGSSCTALNSVKCCHLGFGKSLDREIAGNAIGSTLPHNSHCSSRQKTIWPGAAEHPQCTLNTQVLIARILKGCKWSHGWYFFILLIYFFHPASLSLDSGAISEIRTQKKILTELNSLCKSEMTLFRSKPLLRRKSLYVHIYNAF